MTGPAGFFTVLTAGAVSGGVAGAIAGYSAKNSTAVMQSAYNSGLAAGFETGVAMIFTGAGAAVQILVGAGAAATTNVIGQLAHGVSLNQLNYASIGWSALQGGAFAAVGKAAMNAGCKLGITPFCFAPDTPISTGQGFLPISIIEQFQEVWAFNFHAERWELCPVLEKFEFDYVGDIVHASVYGPAGHETIDTTPGHPFWVIEGERLDERPRGEHILAITEDSPVPGRWLDAEHLREGDLLLLKHSKPQRITSVRLEPYAGKVYNLLVDSLHTYAVGFHGALVHNACSAAQLALNKLNGASAEATALQLLKAGGNTILGTEVRVLTSAGIRRIDILIRTATNKIIAVEVKSGNTSRRASQLLKDGLLATEGGVFQNPELKNRLTGQLITTIEWLF